MTRSRFPGITGTLRCALALLPLLAPVLGHAQDEAPTLDSGDTAWMLTATVLVLFMTIPGLALFYGGLVRTKNVLSVLLQCLAITSLVTVLWVVFGYSLAFDQLGLQVDAAAGPTLIGGISKLFLRGVSSQSLVGSVPVTLPSAVMCSWSSRRDFTRPKSSTLATSNSRPSRHRKRLCGLMSRWRSPAACASPSERQAWRSTETARSGGRAPYFRTIANRSMPSSSSMTK